MIVFDLQSFIESIPISIIELAQKSGIDKNVLYYNRKTGKVKPSTYNKIREAFPDADLLKFRKEN